MTWHDVGSDAKRNEALRRAQASPLQVRRDKPAWRKE